jgi:hypothetical protein
MQNKKKTKERTGQQHPYKTGRNISITPIEDFFSLLGPKVG